MARTQKVEAIRQFRHLGENVGIGSVMTLPSELAIELRGAGKVVFVEADVPDLMVRKLVPSPARKDGGGK